MYRVSVPSIDLVFHSKTPYAGIQKALSSLNQDGQVNVYRHDDVVDFIQKIYSQGLALLMTNHMHLVIIQEVIQVENSLSKAV